MGSSYSNTAGVRCLLVSQRFLQSFEAHLEALQSALFMGLLDDADLQRFDTFPFDETQVTDMRAAAMAGLELWERDAVARHFGHAKSLLIVGAAGAREMVGFAERGFRVEGVDYSDKLVRQSNEILVTLGAAPTISSAPRFELPFAGGRFDGVVIARKFYSMIHNRQRRIELLTKVRGLVPAGAPLLISYFVRSRNTVTFRMQAALANLLRRLRGGRPDVEMGDHIDPESPLFHHHFIPAEIRAEFMAAGFMLVHHDQSWFGHAVGTAAPNAETAAVANVAASTVASDRDNQFGTQPQMT